MSGWQTVKLEAIADVIDSLHQTPEYSDIGYPMVRVTDIKKGSLDLSNTLKVTKVIFDKFSKNHIPRKGDIVFSRVGSYGNTSFVNTDIEFCLGQNTAFIVPKQNPLFLYYFLNSPLGANEIEASVAGSTQPTVSLKSIRNFELPLPSLPEQKAIAAVLSSLDDKIDLLHRQNQTLEAMAETLFRQWFVVEAGGDWVEGVLDEAISVKGGTTPSTKEPEYWDGDIRWTTPRDLSNHNAVFMFDSERKITEKGLAQIGSGLLPIGTVLLSSRAPIGYLAITDIPVAINQGYIAIVCDKRVSNYFMYLWCKANMEDIKSAGNGSTFEEISKSDFKALALRFPPEGKLHEFDKVVSPTFEKVRTNQMQIRTLETLRDTLLPKLMSGEVRVACDA